MRLVILGGTFNPVHSGHLKIAQRARDEFGYDTILAIPAFIPAHKEINDWIEPEHRMCMLKEVCQNSSYLAVDDCEIKRRGVSYTIDTVRYISDSYEFEGKPGLIIGDDLIAGFRTWKEVDRLVSLVDIIIAHRESSRRRSFPYPHTYMSNEIFAASSSEIRKRVKLGSPVSHLMPPEVVRYISENKLYTGEAISRHD